MKSVFLATALLLSTSVFANTVQSTVAEIESQYNARCEKIKTSFNLCLGPDSYSSVCYYSYKYVCFSQEGDFTAKLKMKSSYNFDLNKRVEKVRKVKIKK